MTTSTTSAPDDPEQTVEDTFRAMGSDIHLMIVGGSADLLTVGRDRIEQLESRWSRFQATSEISRLNAAAGQPCAVSADTTLLVEHAVEAWRLTGGGFDPMQLHAVVAAGYDRSFEELSADRAGAWPRSVASAASIAPSGRFDLGLPGCTDIVFGNGTITIPAGAGFDPGGIGKGLAADLVAFELMEAGAAGVCVNMGGDVRVIGRSPTGSGWTVAIEHPHQSSPIVLVGLAEGAVATSSVLRRVWTVDGERRHHLIDPATGEPSTSDVALATVVASHAWLAEVLAKAVLLRGGERAFDLLDDSAAALIVLHDAALHTTVGFRNFVGDAVLPAQLQLDHPNSNLNLNPGPELGNERALS